MAHTPGPWELQDPMGNEELWVVEQGRQPYNWRCIATVTIVGGEIGDITPTEGSANARLIAAAPDLLAALEEIAEGDGCNCRVGPGCDWKCKDIAHAAIAKAKRGK